VRSIEPRRQPGAGGEAQRARPLRRGLDQPDARERRAEILDEPTGDRREHLVEIEGARHLLGHALERIEIGGGTRGSHRGRA
jgi:hypothetical protein